MLDKIKRVFHFDGFGDVEKIIGLVIIFISFAVTLYMYFANVFNI